MENQHQKITGYRDLSQAEIDLMNECKALAMQCGEMISKIRAIPQIPDPIDHRWISIGATHLQEGWMAVIRGIAQPSTF